MLGRAKARATGGDAPTDAEPEAAAPEDPDRVLRHRLVFALATLLIGSIFLIFAATVLAFALSGRLSLLFAAGASLLSIGVFTLVARPPLRAALAYRPENDELRSAAGFLSLACGFLLLASDVVFLVFTLSVLLSQGGASALFVLPLTVLLFFTYRFVREATDDFLKRIRLRREFTLFLVSLGYFIFVGFVFAVLAAAAVASPVELNSPPNGSQICQGTVLDFEINPLGAQSATWDNGSGPQPLASPFDVSTAGWPAGPTTTTITVFDNTGRSHVSRFNFTLTASPCP